MTAEGSICAGLSDAALLGRLIGVRESKRLYCGGKPFPELR